MRTRFLRTAAGLAVFLGIGLFGRLLSAPKSPVFDSVSVVAHRAGAGNAPENTLAALEKAARTGADMAEIDIQQTRDGVLVALHDSNLKRVAGLDANIWELDYRSLAGLDAGSFFSENYAGEEIPTLEEILKTAKGRMPLMLELKSTGYEEGMGEKAVAAIIRLGMEEECGVASMNPGLLKEAKEAAPGITATYISRTMESAMLKADYVDCYSVEASFLTPEDVRQAHLLGRKVYGWTANREPEVKKLLRCRVDGIISDNPEMVEQCMDSYAKLE